MNNPKITVVTVCFNAVKSIEETIQSVLNQTYDNIEYIIIDGASTDGTVDIIKKYADRLTYWVSEPDKGIYDAMNKGIEMATGDYINFMNAGDKFADSIVISSISEILDDNVDVLYGDYYILNQNKSPKLIYKTPLKISKAISKVISKNPICHQAIFAKLQYLKIHNFNLSYKVCADWNFLREGYIEHKLKFLYINFPICIFDCSEGMSHDNIDQNYKERYKILNYDKNIIKKLPYEILRYAVHLKKKILHVLL